MKWIKNFMVSLILLTNIFTDVRAATDEDLATIFLRLYTGSSLEEYVDASVKDAESLIPYIDNNRNTAVYVHGWNEDINSTSVNTIVPAFLNRNDHNVIAVDWSVIANENYLAAAGDIKSVGIAIASALNDMVNAGLSSKKLHVIGHSLGGQVAGEACRNVNFSMPRLTALDPAGPLFNFNVQRIVKTDAQSVDVIHTDKGFYGTSRQSGTVDFYPNGGHRIQPGCPKLFWPFSQNEFCSHHRSYIYYAESLTREEAFLAVPCSMHNQSSSAADPIVMGYGVPTNAFIRPADNTLIASATMGEGWHNYHHSFPWDYKAAKFGNYGFNLTTTMIDGFAKIGWAYDLKEASSGLVRKITENRGDGTHSAWGTNEK